MPRIERLPGDVETWQVDDVQFVRQFADGSRSDRFLIQKKQPIIDLYADLCEQFQGSRIVELGIFAGGSTAMITLLAAPEKLVACDISTEPVAVLTEFIERKGLSDVVRPYYGVDQGDRGRLIQIVETELGDAPLDLVIDDASHTWLRTVASFEVLFPRLRPGGVFVIEDWPAQYLMAEAITAAQADPASATHAQLRAHYEEAVRRGDPPRPPLARLGAELLLASVVSSDVIAEVRANRYWLAITRGPASLGDGPLDLAALYTDHFGWFVEADDDQWLRRLWEPRSSPLSGDPSS